jgi:hypothetical protein
MIEDMKRLDQQLLGVGKSTIVIDMMIGIVNENGTIETMIVVQVQPQLVALVIIISVLVLLIPLMLRRGGGMKKNALPRHNITLHLLLRLTLLERVILPILPLLPLLLHIRRGGIKERRIKRYL